MLALEWFERTMWERGSSISPEWMTLSTAGFGVRGRRTGGGAATTSITASSSGLGVWLTETPSTSL
jgi:hypothetical protein